MRRGKTVHIIEKSLRHHVIEWCATFFTIVGAIMNARLIDFGTDLYPHSFILFFAGNLLWIFFGLKHKHWGVFTTFLILGIINFSAIIKLWF